MSLRLREKGSTPRRSGMSKDCTDNDQVKTGEGLQAPEGVFFSDEEQVMDAVSRRVLKTLLPRH